MQAQTYLLYDEENVVRSPCSFAEENKQTIGGNSIACGNRNSEHGCARTTREICVGAAFNSLLSALSPTQYEFGLLFLLVRFSNEERSRCLFENMFMCLCIELHMRVGC